MNPLSIAKNEIFCEVLNLIDDIKKVPDKDEEWKRRLEILKDKVKSFFDSAFTLEKEQEDTIKQIRKKVDDLKKQMANLTNAFEEGQATWIWESHLTRFVIPQSKDQVRFSQYQQMLECLCDKKRSVRQESNKRLEKIESALQLQWTRVYHDLANSIRGNAHPVYVDLDEAKKRLVHETAGEERKRIEELFEMTKLLASLMKCGKLACDYLENFEPLPREEIDAVTMMAEWNRDLQRVQKGRLYCMKYDNAMVYLEKYVDKQKYNLYAKIVRNITDINGIRLGKLAWEFEEKVQHYVCKERKVEIHLIHEDSPEWEKLMKITQNNVWSPMHRAALEEMKSLLPRQDGTVNIPDQEIAKCVIPDFLSEPLWRWALDIVDWSKKIIAPTERSEKRTAPVETNSPSKRPRRV